MRKHSLALSATVICTAIALCNAAQAGSYKFKILKIPGEYAVYATGVTNQDVVVGYSDDNLSGHGFVWEDGKYTTVDVPGNADNGLDAVNARGVAAGAYRDVESGYSQVFTYDIATGVQTFLPIDPERFFIPEAIGRQGTVVGYAAGEKRGKPSKGFFDTRNGTRLLRRNYDATGIDDAGEIVGHDAGLNQNEGFIFKHGSYTLLDAPGASSTFPTFVTPAGVIGGYFIDSSNNDEGFTLASGVYTTYAHPKSSLTRVVGLTSRGDVAGNYATFRKVHPFVLVNGTYYTINPPHSHGAVITGVNANGTLVGNYTRGYNQYAFIAICSPDQRPCTQ